MLVKESPGHFLLVDPERQLAALGEHIGKRVEMDEPVDPRERAFLVGLSLLVDPALVLGFRQGSGNVYFDFRDGSYVG